MDASRLDDFVAPLDLKLYTQNDKLRNKLAKIYSRASREGEKEVNEMNKYLYPQLNIPKIPQGMTYFGNFLSPVDSKYWVRSPFQQDPPRIHPKSHIERPHAGVDLGTPLDTPLKSTVEGTVLNIGNNPGGYGY